MLGELAKESLNENFRIVDISGNDKITLTYRDVVGARAFDNTKEIMRDSATESISSGEPNNLDRITVEVKVTDIVTLYRALNAKHITIDYFFDY